MSNSLRVACQIAQGFHLRVKCCATASHLCRCSLPGRASRKSFRLRRSNNADMTWLYMLRCVNLSCYMPLTLTLHTPVELLGPGIVGAVHNLARVCTCLVDPVHCEWGGKGHSVEIVCCNLAASPLRMESSFAACWFLLRLALRTTAQSGRAGCSRSSRMGTCCTSPTTPPMWPPLLSPSCRRQV